MIGLLAKIFIKDDSSNPEKTRGAYGKLCCFVGICLNILLFGIKLFAGIISGAISVISDAFNNLTDATSSLISLLGFRLSEQKADKDHPFGHGRFEYISGFIVSMLIILVGFELGKTSVEKIITPEAVEFSYVAVIILVVSIVIKAYMAFYNFRISKKISSAAMRATATDSLSDCIATTAVLMSLIIAKIFEVNIDAYCGLAVSGFILFSGLRSAKETIDPLLGGSPSEEYIKEITTIVYSYEGVKGIHDLIVHNYGPNREFASVHVEVPQDIDIVSCHERIDTCEKLVKEKLGVELVVHMDPIETDNEEINSAKETISTFLRTIHPDLSVHDFRMTPKSDTHINFIFDDLVSKILID